MPARSSCWPWTALSPQAYQDVYFPNLWNQQVVAGKHYQFPWYQGIPVDLVNRQVYDKTGLKIEDFPKTIDGLPACARRSRRRPVHCATSA